MSMTGGEELLGADPQSLAMSLDLRCPLRPNPADPSHLASSECVASLGSGAQSPDCPQMGCLQRSPTAWRGSDETPVLQTRGTWMPPPNTRYAIVWVNWPLLSFGKSQEELNRILLPYGPVLGWGPGL